MRRMTAAFGVLLVVAMSALSLSAGQGAATSGETTYGFRCHSAVGSSDTTYTVAAQIPARVHQGHKFNLAKFVLTGTPAVPLLIVHMHVEIGVSSGADVSVLSEEIDGPGASNPPGPAAPAGVPNSTSPAKFRLHAVGPVGEEITFKLLNVSSTVMNPDDHAQTISVECAYSSGGSFASIGIVPNSDNKATPTLPVPTTTAADPTAIAAHPTPSAATPAAAATTHVKTSTSHDTKTTTTACDRGRSKQSCNDAVIANRLIGFQAPEPPPAGGATIAFTLLILAFVITLAVIARRGASVLRSPK